MTHTEAAIAKALEGHFYVMHYTPSVAVVDKGQGAPEPRRVCLPWSNDDLRTLWTLKTRGLTFEQIGFEMERDSSNCYRMWRKREEWKPRLAQTKPQRPKPRPRVPVARIWVAVAKIYGIPLRDLTGPTRRAQVSEARQVFYYLARHLTHLSLPQIAEKAGRKDHSTVYRGIDKIASRPRQYRDTIGLCLTLLGVAETVTEEVAA